MPHDLQVGNARQWPRSASKKSPKMRSARWRAIAGRCRSSAAMSPAMSQGVAERIGEHLKMLDGLEEVTTRLLADQARVSDSTDEARLLSEQAKAKLDAGREAIEGTIAGLQGPDRAGRPAGRADGRFRHGDEPGPDRLLDDRDDRPQDQHAGAQCDDRGRPRRRCRAQLRGRRRRSEEARPRHPRRDQPDRARPSAS